MRIDRRKVFTGISCFVAILPFLIFQNCAGNVQFSTETPPLDSACGFLSAPTELNRSADERITLRLTNTGGYVWDKEESGTTVQAFGTAPLGIEPAEIAVEANQPIPPGEYWDVAVKIKAHQNRQPGESLALSWVMNSTQSGPFGQSCMRRFVVTGPKDFDAEIVRASIKSPMKLGEEQAVKIIVKNIGLRDWVGGQTDSIRFRLDSAPGAARALTDKMSESILGASQIVKSGETIEFNLQLFAPLAGKSFQALGSMRRNTDPFGAELAQTILLEDPGQPKLVFSNAANGSNALSTAQVNFPGSLTLQIVNVGAATAFDVASVFPATQVIAANANCPRDFAPGAACAITFTPANNPPVAGTQTHGVRYAASLGGPAIVTNIRLTATVPATPTPAPNVPPTCVNQIQEFKTGGGCEDCSVFARTFHIKANDANGDKVMIRIGSGDCQYQNSSCPVNQFAQVPFDSSVESTAMGLGACEFNLRVPAGQGSCRIDGVWCEDEKGARVDIIGPFDMSF